jgi:predicted MPP superfamily phosphohydrolase
MKFLAKLSLFAVVTIMFLSGCHKESTVITKEPPQDDITILQATDLHFLSPTLYDDGPLFQEILANGDGKMVTYTNEITDAFLEEVIEQKPNCLVLTGDLTYNGEKDSHMDLIKKLKKVESSGIVVLVIPGNHDLNSTGAARFYGDSYTLVDSIDQNEFKKLYQDFGLTESLSHSETSFSYIYDTKKGYWLLCVDSNTEEHPGSVDDETLTWIERQLQTAQKKGVRVLAVSHQNLLVHNNLFSFGYQIYNSSKLAALYKKYDVALNLSGHMHIQHTMEDEGTAEVATSAMSVYNCQYGVISLTPAKTTYQTNQVDISSWAKRQNSSDSNLLNFKQYAGSYFDQAAIGKRRSELTELGISAADITAMTNYAAMVNRAYFSGRLDQLPEDKVANALWQKQKDTTFFANYLNEIRQEGMKNHCLLTILHN